MVSLFVTLLTLSNPLVLIPTSSKGADRSSCIFSEQIAARLGASPLGASKFRVLRAPLLPKESLEQARQRLSADWAFLARRTNRLQLERAGPDGTKPRAVKLEQLDQALRELWPKDLELPKVRLLGAASAAALDATCADDATKAYALSGAAVGPALMSRLAPPSVRATDPLLVRFAFAKHRAAEGQCKAVRGLLERIVSELSRGALAPVWRRAPQPERLPSALGLFSERLLIFESGTFVAIEPQTGRELWSLEVGIAEPELFDLGGGLLLAILENGVIAIDAKTGKERWQKKMSNPSDQMFVQGAQLIMASSTEVLSLDKHTGALLWSHDPLSQIIAGPRKVKSSFAIGAGSQIVFLSPTNGEVIRSIELKDEVSSTIAVTPLGRPWVMSGAGDVLLIDARAGQIERRISDFAGAEWPPAFVGERPVLASKRGKRRFVAYLDPSVNSGLARVLGGSAPPVLALPDYSGVVLLEGQNRALVARDFDGRVLWRSQQRATIRGASIARGKLTAGAGRDVVIIDHKKGKQLSSIRLDDTVIKVVQSEVGGAALMEDGTLYGLVGERDDRPLRWLHDARLALGQCYLQVNQRSRALRLANILLSRSPDDLDALVLRASASQLSDPAGALGTWLDITQRTSPQDPAQVEAAKKLRERAGIRSIRARAQEVAISPATKTLLIATEKGLVARREGTVRWRREPSKSIANGGEGSFTVGDKRYAAEDGKLLGGTGQHPATVIAGRWFEQREGTLTRRGKDGSVLWERPMSGPYKLLSANTKGALLSQRDGAQLTVLDLKTGEPRWTKPMDAPVQRGWLSATELLVALGDRFLGMDPSNGERRFTISLAPKGVDTVVPFELGFALLEARTVRLVEPLRGKMRLVRLPGKLTHFAAVGSQGIAALSDGRLVGIDGVRGRVTGRARLGTVQKLEVLGEEIVALLRGPAPSQGLLVLIDPAQGLLPKR